jgi:hypothetical protein
MIKARVDIAVACAPNQIPQWWGPIMQALLKEQRDGLEIGHIHTSNSALPDSNKNKIVAGDLLPKNRLNLTDENRMKIAKQFLQKDSEWIFWIDDDTVPPPGAIRQLLEAQREMIAGVYFNNNPPHLPIAYIRREDGLYMGVPYRPGGLVQVDSVGMGCTLIHRSVYERIMAEHTVVSLPNGSLTAVHNSNVKDSKYAKPGKEQYIRGGYLHTPITEIREDDNRAWPFYMLEHGRTEDHWFCELLANVGIRPWLDYSVVCKHWKPKATTIDTYDAWEGSNEQT